MLSAVYPGLIHVINDHITMILCHHIDLMTSTYIFNFAYNYKIIYFAHFNLYSKWYKIMLIHTTASGYKINKTQNIQSTKDYNYMYDMGAKL